MDVFDFFGSAAVTAHGLYNCKKKSEIQLEIIPIKYTNSKAIGFNAVKYYILFLVFHSNYSFFQFDSIII